MIKKRAFAFLCLLAFLFSISFALAEENATNVTLTGFEKSYNCLKTKIDQTTYASMTNEELSFSLLALAYDKTRQDAIKNELDTRADVSTEGRKCWPSGACTLKETSQVLLAYYYIGADTSEIKSWLYNQTIATGDLVWYLQIDTSEQTDCTLTYENASKKITVNADKTISGTPGACFRLVQNNYWLEVVSSCYDKNIEITCNNDFLTSIIYRGKNQNTYYVSDITNTAATGGKITEKINSLCFSQGGTCNYEGSLWATFALNKDSPKNTKLYLPYIMTFSSTNSRLLPSAFLYALTGFDEYYTELSSQQNSLGYWQASDTSKRYYDTALALMALYGKLTEQEQKAKDYLLTPSVQGDGCWQNSIRDTAFILYAASPKPASKGVSTIVERTFCTSIANYSCLSTEECEDINGTTLENFYCFGGAICCNKKALEKTCSEKGGVECTADEKCTGTLTTARGTSYCCLDGTCKVKTPEISPCEEAGYSCRIACDAKTEEEMVSLSCPSFGTCCAPKPREKRSYWWIWLLIILIILIILAIIFRDQLKVWWFKIKGKVSKAPAPIQQRPPFPPAGIPRRIIPGIMPPAMPRPQPQFPKERELSETLSKLKEMSK